MGESSRIPKIPMRSVKRPCEAIQCSNEKKVKTEVPMGPPKLPKSRSATNLRGTLGAAVVGRFSEIPKQRNSHSKMLTNILNVRESMPARAPTNYAQRKPLCPPRNLSCRVQDIEKEYSTMKETLHTVTDRLTLLEKEKSNLSADLEAKSAESVQSSVEVEKLKKDLRETVEQLQEKNNEIQKLKAVLEAEERKLFKIKHERDNLEFDLKAANKFIEKITDDNQSMIANQKCLQIQLDASKIAFTKEQEENAKCKRQIQEYEMKAQSLEEKIREEEMERRKQHNIIQELKGNIRVFCRIRPLLDEEIKNNIQGAHIVQKNNGKTIEISSSSDVPGQPHSTCEFSFDHIFPSSSTQYDVFQEISQLVQSALDGYNVCIFAYGQTGSGKTFTMEGPQETQNFIVSSDDSKIGIIPRTVKQIFDTARKLKEKGWNYTMGTSFLEIYNENIRDLLADNNCAPKCEIKKSGVKGSDSYISNVKTVHVSSEKEVADLLRKAKHNRAVASTYCNEYSSRSHYIFQMKVVAKNELTGQNCEGILNLIDLAGSERVKESGSSGERLIEAKNINKSLSNLGNVIMALSKKADHIPYRNSKLTHLLMNSLGGSSKALMFVNISPSETNFGETINSLRFATKVNQCHIGTAEKRIK